MQYQLPQFVEAEDKVIGPLTLKQFLYLLGAGGLIFLYWSVFKVSVWFFMLTLPTAFIAAVITFAQFGGRPAVKYALPLLHFFLYEHDFVFRRTHHGHTSRTSVSTPNTQQSMTSEAEPEKPESRLKRLAYVLDQRAKEEENLLEKAHN